MTIITGHNQIIQHAGKAQELAHQNHSPKPSAEAAIPVQQEREIQERSTVQSSEDANALKRERKGRDSRDEKEKREKLRKRDRELDPDSSGRLLDTVI